MNLISHIKIFIDHRIVRTCLFLLYIFFIPCLCYGQKELTVQISNIDFRLVEDNVIINYDITDSVPNGKYYIEMEVFNSEGKIIEAKTVEGDVNKMVKPGNNKMIIWEIKNDYPDFNESISVTISALQYIKGSLGKQLLVSTIYPGLGLYNKSKKKPYLILGLTGYGLIGTSLVFEKKALDSYNTYKQMETAEQRNNYYDKATQNRKISNQLLISGIAVWAINYGLIIFQHTRDESKFIMKQRSNLSVNMSYKNKPIMAITYIYNF